MGISPNICYFLVLVNSVLLNILCLWTVFRFWFFFFFSSCRNKQLPFELFMCVNLSPAVPSPKRVLTRLYPKLQKSILQSCYIQWSASSLIKKEFCSAFPTFKKKTSHSPLFRRHLNMYTGCNDVYRNIWTRQQTTSSNASRKGKKHKCVYTRFHPNILQHTSSKAVWCMPFCLHLTVYIACVY